MNLQEYIQNAIRTESYNAHNKEDPESISFDKSYLIELLYTFAQAGGHLDDVKKYIFYRRPPKVLSFDEERETTLNINRRIFHAVLGIATEATEAVEALADHLKGDRPLDIVNLREEMGDLCWYMAIFYDALRELGFDGSWEGDLEKNIAKLRARYPEKFTTEQAINRDTVNERSIYEDRDE